MREEEQIVTLIERLVGVDLLQKGENTRILPFFFSLFEREQSAKFVFEYKVSNVVPPCTMIQSAAFTMRCIKPTSNYDCIVPEYAREQKIQVYN